MVFMAFWPKYKSGFRVCYVCFELIMAHCRLMYVLDKIKDSGAFWNLGRIESETLKLELIFGISVDR